MQKYPLEHSSGLAIQLQMTSALQSQRLLTKSIACMGDNALVSTNKQYGARSTYSTHLTLMAMAIAPSFVACPPINPLA